MSLDDRALDIALRRGMVQSEDLPAPRPPASECLDRLVAQRRLTLGDLASLRAEAERGREGGERLGPYELLDEVGRGGMGAVWRARDTRLGREVAVKVMIAGEHASPEAIARFMREAQAAGQLGVHPNLVTVLDVGNEGARHFIVMDLVDGKPLDKLIDEGAIAPKRAAEMARQVAVGVAHAHAKGILHRDLKPANVLVTRDGVPKLTDFGLARFVEDAGGLTRSGALVGTPHYMAPEQAEGRLDAINVRTDVYGLGATLYEMLTERPPFDGGTSAQILRQVLLEEPRAPRRLNPAVPRDLETICLKALQKEPARRYPTAQELADDLARFGKGEPIAARPISRAGRVVRWARRRPAAAVAGAALAALAVAGTSVTFAAGRRLAERARDVSSSRAAIENGNFATAARTLAGLSRAHPGDAQIQELLERAEAGVAREREGRDREREEAGRQAVAERALLDCRDRLARLREVVARLRAARDGALAAQERMIVLGDPGEPAGPDRSPAFSEARGVRRQGIETMRAIRDDELERAFGAVLAPIETALTLRTDEAAVLAAALFRERIALERDLGRPRLAAMLDSDVRRMLAARPDLHPPTTGRLRLETRPSGADVVISSCDPDSSGRRAPGPERPLGRTPVEGVEIPAGSYVLRLRAPGYRDVTYPVWVLPGETAGTTEAILLLTEEEIGSGFVYVPGGDSWLGEPEPQRDEFLWSRHRVRGFLLSRHEVTVREWAEFVGALARKDPRQASEALPFGGDTSWGRIMSVHTEEGGPVVRLHWAEDNPVVAVRQPDALSYAAWRAGAEGRPLRLPREREWERAARGADSRSYPFGDQFLADGVVHEGWPGFRGGRLRVRPVGAGTWDESPFGVRDLAGSVSEWCDGHLDPASGVLAFRGGNWGSADWQCRSSRRSGMEEDIRDLGVGLRLACDLPPR